MACRVQRWLEAAARDRTQGQARKGGSRRECSVDNMTMGSSVMLGGSCVHCGLWHRQDCGLSWSSGQIRLKQPHTMHVCTPTHTLSVCTHSLTCVLGHCCQKACSSEGGSQWAFGSVDWSAKLDMESTEGTAQFALLSLFFLVLYVFCA